jgi:hypothetical protein
MFIELNVVLRSAATKNLVFIWNRDGVGQTRSFAPRCSAQDDIKRSVMCEVDLAERTQFARDTLMKFILSEGEGPNGMTFTILVSF